MIMNNACLIIILIFNMSYSTSVDTKLTNLYKAVFDTI